MEIHLEVKQVLCTIIIVLLCGSPKHTYDDSEAVIVHEYCRITANCCDSGLWGCVAIVRLLSGIFITVTGGPNGDRGPKQNPKFLVIALYKCG